MVILDSREGAEPKSDFLTATVKADLEKTNFDRQQALWDKRISAESAFLNAKAVYSEATLRVDLARQKHQGLQQVVLVGRPLGDVAAASAWEAMRREGVRRHGEPRTGLGATALERPEARTTLAMRIGNDGTRMLVMTVSRPWFAACSAVHRGATGHPAEAHVTDLLGENGPQTGHDTPP